MVGRPGWGRRTVLVAAGALSVPSLARPQAGDPTRTVPVVNAHCPGGTADVVCRFAPAGTDAGLIRHLNTELSRAVRDAEALERLNGLGALARANTVEEFAESRETQTRFFAEMVRMADIRIN